MLEMLNGKTHKVVTSVCVANTKNNKNETAEHRCSTGFEALIGYLYLKDDHERIKEIFQELINYVNGTNLKQI